MDFTPIIEPLRGPTCMFKTSKISTQVEIASWARVWQNLCLKCSASKMDIRGTQNARLGLERGSILYNILKCIYLQLKLRIYNNRICSTGPKKLVFTFTNVSQNAFLSYITFSQAQFGISVQVQSRTETGLIASLKLTIYSCRAERGCLVAVGSYLGGQ